MRRFGRFWAVFGLVAVIVVVLALMLRHRAMQPAGLKSFVVQGGGEANRFQGKVTRVVSPVSEDGANYMEVDGHILVLMNAGGLRPANDAGVKGNLIGGIGLGNKVEVYAAKVGKDSYTMYGSKDYYVKAIN